MNEHVLYCTCLHMLQGRCGSFFGSTTAVGDEYSRAVLEIFDKLSIISAKLSVHMTSVDDAEKDWCLFDIWDRRFDKLPVISAKLSLRVMGADVSGKDWRLFDIWDRRFDKLPVIFAKLSLRVTGADASGKARCHSDF
ncbi:hypothetical protein ACFXTI_007303 [Malus domestica]